MNGVDYSINPFHQVHHSPYRFNFIKLDISIKDQEKIKDYLENVLSISIRIKRESGVAIFMTDKEHVNKTKKYFYDHADFLITKFGIRNFELDVDKEMFESNKGKK
jgi:hypothetical protein